jgi:hypothetical protein
MIFLEHKQTDDDAATNGGRGYPTRELEQIIKYWRWNAVFSV